ncbi:MAG: hypothetical protein AB1704_23295 [Pseudomonadota bacterium]|jgi:hypothetical protein|uniref:hypothetical protein n=1 Tax=Burkholderiaceae TaxID=119060 RepID=UPI0010F9ACFD|nr:hypothetical protein [Burkholderia sp. 4M9327F10]
MSTLFAPHATGADGAARPSTWLNRLRVPLAQWSGRRRFVVGGLIGIAVFCAGANAWISTDLAGVHAGRAALVEARHRLVKAQHSLGQLPELRRSVAALPIGPVPQPWTPADDVRLISLLAARTGVTLLTLAPGAGNGAGLDAMSSMHLTAQADFLHLLVFLRGLSDLPLLVVPEDVTVRRSAGVLLISANLHLFHALTPAPGRPELFADEDLEADDEEVEFDDPFSLQRQADGAEVQISLLRLVGLLRDSARGLALLETADGATAVERGQRVGDDRVTGMDALSITLTNRAGTRTLALTEAS